MESMRTDSDSRGSRSASPNRPKQSTFMFLSTFRSADIIDICATFYDILLFVYSIHLNQNEYGLVLTPYHLEVNGDEVVEYALPRLIFLKDIIQSQSSESVYENSSLPPDSLLRYTCPEFLIQKDNSHHSISEMP
eukprot:c30655_g1_i1.p1 GENE.c30655_g1_i1~~c30655_g1_i1.p1  ORF type:complete len:143 (+),score=58.91 c30655_g1_i1:26-430(+)